MDTDLLMSLVADCAVALAFSALMMSLAAVSRHPALVGGVRYALGHLGFAMGSSLFILTMGEAGSADRPLAAWAGLLASTAGGAAMVDGMARLLEHPRRVAIGRAAWGAGLLLALAGALPLTSAEPQRLASDITNALAVAGLAAVLLRGHAAPYRMPAWTAGAATAALAMLYLVGAIQGWAGSGPVLLPPYASWMWLDLALWNTINLCVMILASFRALVIFVRRSRTDALTHCLNRSGFDDEVQQLALRLPADTPVTVLALDIDHFKAINDRCGHGAGDAYLVRFAQALQGCVRQSDLVARIGGEEFLAVLIDAHPEAGERVAAKMLDAIRQLEVLCDEHRLRTTVSIGIASGAGMEAIAPLLRRADRALYGAKSAGRDRVSSAGPGETTGGFAAAGPVNR